MNNYYLYPRTKGKRVGERSQLLFEIFAFREQELYFLIHDKIETMLKLKEFQQKIRESLVSHRDIMME